MNLEVVSGKWEIEGTQYTHVQNGNLFPDSLVVSKQQERDARIEFSVILKDSPQKVIHSAGVIFRYQDPSHYYFAGIGGYDKKFVIGKRVGGITYPIASYGDNSELETNREYKMELLFKGRVFTLNLKSSEGEVKLLEVINNQDDIFYAKGNYGLKVFGNQNTATVAIKNVVKIPSDCFIITPLRKPDSQWAKEVKDVGEIIRKAGKRLGLNPIDASQIFDNQPIINDIVTAISNSTLVIANITPMIEVDEKDLNKYIPNANVFYELGVAHTLNANTIIICRKDSYPKFPFDIAHLRILEFPLADKKEAKKELKEKLESTIATILERSQTGETPLHNFSQYT